MSTVARYLLGFTLLALSCAVQAGPNLALDNVLVYRSNGVSQLQIRPACRMQYLSHSPANEGVELRVHLRLLEDCGELLADIGTERYQPAGQRLANVTDVEFERVADSDEAYLTLYFSQPSSFAVDSVVLGRILIDVDTNIDPRTLPANVPESLEPPPAAEPPPIRAPLPTEPRRVVRAPRQQAPSGQGTGRYAVQLGVFDDTGAAIAALAQVKGDYLAYTTTIDVNARRWFGLQVGFFATESDADLVLSELSRVFPDAWVRAVTPEEVANAATARLDADAGDGAVAVSVVHASGADDNRIGNQMRGARRSFLERDYGQAIATYTEILGYADHPYRAQAREYLAVALERSGQRERALAEYDAYLAEFSGDDDVTRVAARRNALNSALDAMPTQPTANTATARPVDGWQLFGGVSQVYWRNQEQRVHDGNHLVSSSGVLALADLTAVRRGERFDVTARVNGAYQFNLVDFDSDGDTGWLSYGYLDVDDRLLNLQATVGRQVRRQDGVLDRFDGVGLTYRWRPDIAFSVSAGLPVDSPRFTTGSHRNFYAASVEMDDIFGLSRISLFNHHQFVDGILDRQAIGGEVQYLDDRLNLVGLVDYDLSYGVLNTALVNAGFNLDNGWRLNGIVRTGAQPYLTTRNALAGQTVRSIDELLDTYTEGQIRRIARDRTAQALTASVGVAIPLSERLQLMFDVTTRTADATESSAGVEAIPATDSQLYLLARLTGSSLLAQGDLSILTLRHDSTRTRDTSTAMLDMRIPLTEGLRINPRLIVSSRTDNLGGTEQLLAKPSLRVLYRRKRLTLDVEVGGYWSNRDLPPLELDPFTVDGTEELTGGFINAGYRWEF